MRFTSYHKRIVFLILCLGFCTLLRATDGDSARKKRSLPVPVRELPANGRLFSELDKYLPQQQFTMQPQQVEFTEQYFEQFNIADPTIEEYKARARAAVGVVENSNSFVDYLEPSDINKLPIGLRKKVGNTEIAIAISSAVFTPTYAKLTAFARVKIPQAPYQLFFGVTDLMLSYNGGIIGNAKLALLGDIAIPINGNSAALILKGGFDIQSGQVLESATYITIDCNGFKELGLTADVEFPRSMLLPVNAQGNVQDGRVTCGFTNVKISNWNDILATVSFETPFQVKGLSGINFQVTTAAFDFSDIRNNPDVVYPQGYQQKYLQAETINTWRGVYIKDLNISLPPSFKDKTNPTQPVSFGVTDLIADNNGLTGIFYARDILPINKGNAGGWKFSVDSIHLAVEANHLMRAGFGGKIGLPLSNDNDTTNKRKFLAYSAVITANSEYVCRVTTLDSIDFDLWKAKVLLKPNSYIQLTGNSTEMRPEAMLHGKMGIVVKTTDENPGRDPTKKPVYDFQGITFEGLHLTTQAPYVTAQYFGYSGEVRLGNFPVSIADIGLKSLPNNETAVAFTLKINLQDGEFSGSTRLNIVGKLNEQEGIRSWKYDRIKLEEIEIKADIKGSFVLEGRVKFMDDDPEFGDGFDGSLKAEFKKGLNATVSVKAVFGKKDTYRYWYVDGKADLGTGIGGFIKLQGFGGGAYYRMKKVGYNPEFSPTGTVYKPDSTAGLGVKAAVIFSVASKKIAKGEASFEISFNKGGGIRYLGIFGYAKILGDIPGLNNVTEFVGNKFKAIEDKLQTINMDTATLNRLKILQPSAAAEKTYPTTEKPGEQGLSAYIGIQYDFNASTLHASFDMYINAAAGLLKGAASGNRAGWAVLHISPSEWYLHIGRPDDRLGVKFGIGSLRLQTGAYFMAGYNIPAFPEPPARLVQILRESGLEYDNRINMNDISGGRGLAFGANVDVSTGDIRFLFFYANFAAGLGFDVMIKDYGDAHCAGSSSPIGINGWYAQGQAYAYLQGELGIRIKILFIKKKIAIIKGGAAAILQAKLPNPTWVGGQMGFHVNILGGLIRGRFNFKFSFGNDCQIVTDDVTEFDDFQVIESITPDHQTTNVSVLANPQIKFSLKPNKSMEFPRDDGNGNDVMMPVLESFKLFEGSTEIAATVSYNTEGNVLTMTPGIVLKANTNYNLKARVTIRQLRNGYWIALTENGQVAEEVKDFAFTTGAAPDTLAHSLIMRMYPFFNQRNFYHGEVNKGVIKLDRSFTSFFEKFGKWKIQIQTLAGVTAGTVYASTNNIDSFSFVVPTNLSAATTYRALLLGEQPAPGSDPNKPGLIFTFTTSQYATLAAKVSAMNRSQAIVSRISSDVIDLQAAVNPYEGFELYEVAGIGYTDNKPMIEGELNVTNEQYYNDFIKPLVYPDYPGHMQAPDGQLLPIDGPGNLLYGAPPFKAITPAWFYINILQSGVYNDLVRTRMPFVHNANKYYNQHFLELRKKVINKYIGSGSIIIEPGQQGLIPTKFSKLVNEAFPFILKGDYRVKFTLVQLDGTRGSPGEFVYENPID